jgi:DNA-binding SARP family transcriptional activator
MVNLTLFGGVSLERDGRPVAGPAAQRRRLGLLALLGAAPGGLTREKLIGYLWADLPSEQARRFLADSIYTLRKALGQDAIVGAGDTLRLNPDVVRCDVLEFRSAVARHEDEAAVALRRGPFMDGFYVPDAPEVERWSEAERADLERAYAACLDRLALRAQERGDHGAAVRWWRALQAIDSMSSPVAARLAGALERAGDPAGALRVLQEHEATLREELGIAPDAAVTALADRLRAAPAAAAVRPPAAPRGATRQAAPPVVAGAVPTPAPSEEEPPSAPRGRSRPFRRASMRWAAAVAGAALAAVMGIAALVWATADRGPSRVVVETFVNRTGDAALEPLGAMAADWIARSLIAVEGVQVVSPAWADSGATVGSRFPGRSTRGDARVSGAYYRAGGGLRFEARLVDPVAGRLLQGFEPVLVPADSGVLALDLIRQRVAAAVAARSGDAVRREITVRLQPPTYPAYLEYLEGLRLFTRFQSAQAAARFERAVAIDSTFDLARLFGVLMALNTGRMGRADSLLQPVVVRRERLPAFDRALLEALESDLAGDRLGVLRAMRRVSAAVPASQFTVGHAVAAIAAGRPDEARDLLLAVDPDAGPVRDLPRYWEWLTVSRHLLGEHRAELREAREARRRHPDVNAMPLLEVRALAALGRTRELSALLDDAERQPALGSAFAAEAVLVAASELRAHGHAAEAVRVSERGLRWLDGRPDDDQHRWRPLRARLLGEAGRWTDAARILDELVAEVPASVAYRGWRGAVAARLGDVVVAREAAATLTESLANQRGEPALWRARIAAQSGRAGEAVTMLREAFARGHGHGLWLHTDADLAVLRGGREFEALVRSPAHATRAAGS